MSVRAKKTDDDLRAIDRAARRRGEGPGPVRFCRGVARATVRDERSRQLLEPLLPGVQVERTADPVFLFAPGEAPLDLAAEGLEASDPLVIVSVRRWHGADRTAVAIATAVDRLAEAHGARIAFLPLGGAPMPKPRRR